MSNVTPTPGETGWGGTMTVGKSVLVAFLMRGVAFICGAPEMCCCWGCGWRGSLLLGHLQLVVDSFGFARDRR